MERERERMRLQNRAHVTSMKANHVSVHSLKHGSWLFGWIVLRNCVKNMLSTSNTTVPIILFLV